MNFKHTIIFCFLSEISICSFAQQSTTAQDSITFEPRTFTTEEFQNFQIPSLQTLFENARKNPRLSAIEAAIEAARLDTRIAKRDWWSYFSLHAGYNYGILGTYTDQETTTRPLITTYSGANQSSWQVGANINLPLDRLLNHQLNVKKQKQLVENAEYNQQIVFDEIKQEIIELYANVQYQLKMLKMSIDAIILYEADYNVARNDFINNKISTSGLTELKNSQKKAQAEYELIVTQLNIYLLKLEVISNTKLITK